MLVIFSVSGVVCGEVGLFIASLLNNVDCAQARHVIYSVFGAIFEEVLLSIMGSLLDSVYFVQARYIIYGAIFWDVGWVTTCCKLSTVCRPGRSSAVSLGTLGGSWPLAMNHSLASLLNIVGCAQTMAVISSIFGGVGCFIFGVFS